jgi:hypothetical protein
MRNYSHQLAEMVPGCLAEAAFALMTQYLQLQIFLLKLQPKLVGKPVPK